MPDSSAHDENQLTPKAVGHGPVRLRDDKGRQPAASADSPREPAGDAVGSISAQAQETAERLQVAAAELQEQSRAELAAARDAAHDQHEQELERARMAIASLTSHLGSVQTQVTASSERVRRAAEVMALAFENLAREQLEAMREQVVAASSAVDLMAAGMAASDSEERQPAQAAPERAAAEDFKEGPAAVEPEAATADAVADAATPDEPPAPPALPDDLSGSAAELLEDAEPTPDESAPDGAPQSTSDLQHARLTAVNLALNGTPRVETAQHLATTFGLNDEEISPLLDDVYRLAEEAS